MTCLAMTILQELWDRKWSRQNNVLLILCGSYLGFMEREDGAGPCVSGTYTT
jgi:hypothetical protein